MVNMSSKFDKEICNGVDSIAFTRSTYVRGSVTTGQTDTHTHRQTPDKVIPMCRYASQATQSDPYVPLCFAGDTKIRPRFICSVLRASKFSVFKLIEIVILWVYYTIFFGFSFVRHFLDITFQLFKLLWLNKDHWRRLSTRNAHMVNIEFN